jgi:phosphatidylglycerophosphatase C
VRPGAEACETDHVSTPPAPVVAAFDLDGTLSDGGSVFKWLRSICGSRATFFAGARLAGPLLVAAIRSGSRADHAKERLFMRLLVGRDESLVRDASRVFALAHFEEHARARVLDRLRWHLREGHDVVIVSASPQLYVEVVAEFLGVSGGLGTRLSVDPRGLLSGGYLGRNCRGKEKMRRLNEWIEQCHPGVETVIYAYGNSRGDRRMLRAATYPFDVGRLGPVGALRHFPRLQPDAVVPNAD